MGIEVLLIHDVRQSHRYCDKPEIRMLLHVPPKLVLSPKVLVQDTTKLIFSDTSRTSTLRMRTFVKLQETKHWILTHASKSTVWLLTRIPKQWYHKTQKLHDIPTNITSYQNTKNGNNGFPCDDVFINPIWCGGGVKNTPPLILLRFPEKNWWEKLPIFFDFS